MNTDLVSDTMKLLHQAIALSRSVDLSWIQPPPTEGDWRLAPDALRMVQTVVKLLKPRHILELGSGLSTDVLARAAAGTNCVISSVDHDPQYNWSTGRTDASPQPPVPIKFHLAPLVVREYAAKLVGVYLIDPQQFASQAPVDLVVIDGPPVNLGGREGTLYQVMDFARPGTVVLLDDSKRPEERAALKAWADNYGDAVHVEQLPGFAKGMAAVVVRKVVKSPEFWAHRFALNKVDIEQAAPAGVPVILAGPDWWTLEVKLDRPWLPMCEKDGVYNGDPIDDAHAIAELDKLQKQGARLIVIGWPIFWWLSHYTGFVAELSRRGRKVLDNDRLVAFALDQ